MQGRYEQVRRQRQGFTLLEVLLVILILGMLVVLVVPNYHRHAEQARIDLARQLVAPNGTLAGQIELYRTRMGKYPDSLENLTSVPADPEERAKYGEEPFIKDSQSLKDPWGQELQYKYPGETSRDTFDLYSFGPDMKDGGDDDIGNWQTDISR